ncbi:hypothetical protein [Teichococcus vastitatis]|jgi:hypothetical protein|uniref:Uncharacterized protein n=1 Tax=Teichococcus vastitatis TaxID=2307076 RepID=A0ABS9WE33_9PROT|nr:hypothetical protein [Pseudoroseomonas vastitatis]MCI0756975.1 hypothetical protein [Pseudoroseomonas vastitatis]
MADQQNRDGATQKDSGTIRKSHLGQAEQQEVASGTIRQPIQPGEVQPGEMNELAQTLGGPVDVFPAGGRRKTPQSGG